MLLATDLAQTRAGFWKQRGGASKYNWCMEKGTKARRRRAGHDAATTPFLSNHGNKNKKPELRSRLRALKVRGESRDYWGGEGRRLSWNGRVGRWRGWRWTPRAKLCILPGPWQWELWNVDGEEGKARSEEARRGGGGEKASDFRAVHGADCITLSLCRQTMQCTWPCQKKMACPVPALPKMPSDTHRKPYVGRADANALRIVSTVNPSDLSALRVLQRLAQRRDDLHPSITTLRVSSKVPIHESVLIVVPPHFR
ncbi:hypothetical protein BGZ57DRAFT_849529 [Hyaloscypha finlandica]|nr:hypothetical protein BGZ57DRAFT_849529 [Hyaloscypha finlandica]